MPSCSMLPVAVEVGSSSQKAETSAIRASGLTLFLHSLLARFTICHKTEVMKNTLNPVWQTFSIPVRALCNGDYDR